MPRLRAAACLDTRAATALAPSARPQRKGASRSPPLPLSLVLPRGRLGVNSGRSGNARGTPEQANPTHSSNRGCLLS